MSMNNKWVLNWTETETRAIKSNKNRRWSVECAFTLSGWLAYKIKLSTENIEKFLIKLKSLSSVKTFSMAWGVQKMSIKYFVCFWPNIEKQEVGKKNFWSKIFQKKILQNFKKLNIFVWPWIRLDESGNKACIFLLKDKYLIVFLYSM